MRLPVKDKELLAPVLAFAKRKKKKLYLVGGYLRDLALKRERRCPDIDFCLKRGAISFGRRLAGEMKAGFVVLDKEHGACRLVKRFSGVTYTLDFTDFRAEQLEQDLKLRDFTINSIAIELEGALKVRDIRHLLIDPARGLEDLNKGVIKVTSRLTFDQDPLRVLRAFSFSSIFGFKIEGPTVKLIKAKKNKLSGVSFERIRDELFKILDSPRAYAGLRELDKLKILKLIIPEIELMRGILQGPYHHLDVWKHTLETLKQLELLFVELQKRTEIQSYLGQEISFGRSRRALLKLGSLLHDIGKPQALRREGRKIKFYGHEAIGSRLAKEVFIRLRLSNEELDALRKIIFWHLRPGYLADNAELTSRAKFRFFRDAGSEAVSILLHSVADQRATRGRLTSRVGRQQHEKVAFGLIKEYFHKQKEPSPRRLINGNDLMRKFKLSPSPLVGKILSELEELQAIGRVKTRAEALRAAAVMLIPPRGCRHVHPRGGINR